MTTLPITSTLLTSTPLTFATVTAWGRSINAHVYHLPPHPDQPFDLVHIIENAVCIAHGNGGTTLLMAGVGIRLDGLETVEELAVVWKGLMGREVAP